MTACMVDSNSIIKLAWLHVQFNLRVIILKKIVSNSDLIKID